MHLNFIYKRQAIICCTKVFLPFFFCVWTVGWTYTWIHDCSQAELWRKSPNPGSWPQPKTSFYCHLFCRAYLFICRLMFSKFVYHVLQFEDFANHNAFDLLARYGTTHLVFNDDIQVHHWQLLISIVDIWQIAINMSLIFGYSLTAGDSLRGPCRANCSSEISWGNLSWPQISVPWCWRGWYIFCCIEQLIKGLRLCCCYSIEQLIKKTQLPNF